MFTPRSHRSTVDWKWVLVACLAVGLLFIGAPKTASAGPPEQASPGNERCTLCHWSETSQWQGSPHAENNVTCESCHGEFVEEHPEEGGMMLSVEPSLCKECHEANYAQWEGSLHASDNVTCTSCHVSHSQTTRLNSQTLCISCHDDDVGMSWERTAHASAGVTCVDCHLSEPMVTAANEGTGEPGHVFTVVPSQLCINCHAENLHQPATIASGHIAMTGGKLAASTRSGDPLATKLKTVEKENESLQTWVLIMLGLGLGIGAALGIIAMVIFVYISKEREAAS